MAILENIHGHEDLTCLNDRERLTLCRELRTYLVDHVSQTGGHLASNLGAVELTVAIETVFNTMKDRLVFDVGHQSYVHKLLTGRQAGFSDLRQFGGISGFPKPEESESDAFVAGHASSAVCIKLMKLLLQISDSCQKILEPPVLLLQTVISSKNIYQKPS